MAATGQAIAPEFWGYWSSHGLDFGDEGVSFRESLALFGMPVSEPQMEQSSDGNMYMTQWFERARFEFHPENQPPYDVLLGLLGADLLRQQAPPPPQQGLPGIPPITGNCVQNAPLAAEGPQAWMTVPEPTVENQFDSVCARLIVNGQAVKDAKSGQVEFRVEKAGIIHAGIGKASFPEADLKANFDAFVDAIVKAKPSGAKGKYVKKVALSSSMGPGVRIDTAEVAGA